MNYISQTTLKGGSYGFLYVSVYSSDLLGVSSTGYEFEGFENLFYLSMNTKEVLCIFLRHAKLR